MKHYNGVVLVKLPFREGAADLLQDDGGGGGGVVDKGDFVHVIGVDEAFDDGPRLQDSFPESVEVEIVRLFKVFELPFALRSEHGLGAAPEAAVIDPGDAGVVVRELVADIGFGHGQGELGFLGDMVEAVVVAVIESRIAVPGFFFLVHD